MLILNFGFIIWRNERLASRLSCQAKHLWLINPQWIKCRSSRLKCYIAERTQRTLKEYFKILIYKVSSSWRLSFCRSQNKQREQYEHALKIIFSDCFPRAQFVSGRTWKAPLQFIRFIKTYKPHSVSAHWPGIVLDTVYMLPLIW